VWLYYPLLEFLSIFTLLTCFNKHFIVRMISELSPQVSNVLDTLYLWENVSWKPRRSLRILNCLLFRLPIIKGEILRVNKGVLIILDHISLSSR